MGMGGLLEHWHGPEGDETTFTILTINANSLMAKIHDRMPVIIKPEDYAIWIDTNFTDVIKIQAMTRPYPERFMEAYPVSRKVNSPKHDSPDLIEEVQVSRSLFGNFKNGLDCKVPMTASGQSVSMCV